VVCGYFISFLKSFSEDYICEDCKLLLYDVNNTFCAL
jgi:hypothetical protein